MLFEFAIVFYNVSHAWIFVPPSLGWLPEGMMDGIFKSYIQNRAYVNSQEGGLTFIILSGVLLDCPLSGSLFGLAVDPLLHVFQTHMESSPFGWVRACAADFGIAPRRLEHLPILKLLLGSFSRVSGFNLKILESRRQLFTYLWLQLEGSGILNYFEIDPSSPRKLQNEFEVASPTLSWLALHAHLRCSPTLWHLLRAPG